MPHSSVQSYSDPRQMEAAHVAAKAELTPTGRELLTSRSVRVELSRLWLTRVNESGPRIKHVTLSPKRSFITFLTQPGPEVLVQGRTMPAASMVRHSLEHSYYERTTGPTQWGTISMAIDDIATVGEVMCGCDLTPPRGSIIITPKSEAMTRFQNLHAAVGALAEDSPRTIADPEAARGIEQSLIEAVAGCLPGAEVNKERWAHQCHTTIMRRFRRLLENYPDRAMYVPEICAAIGVPDRTLRLCFQEHLGMSPKQYLMLRRMHLVHRVLQASSAIDATVTEVATRHGFWHFGRFAVVYRSLFGQSPSATLNNMAR